VRRLGIALASVILLAGCGGGASSDGELSGSVVDPPFEVGTTALPDTDGRPTTLQDGDARLTLVFFGYTNCATECPAVMSTVTSALTRLSDADRDDVQLVFVSTDPSRDTAEVLRRYLDGYDPSYVGLTGDLEATVELAETVGIFVADAEQMASGGYDLGSHGTQVVGMDASGEAPVFWGMDTSSAQYAADIELLLGGD
jgi:protein SCO1